MALTHLTIFHESGQELENAIARVLKIAKENRIKTVKSVKGPGYSVKIKKDHTTELMVKHVRFETINGEECYVIPSRLNFM